ncbi:hypothetical protein [Brazilian marseillevirus]|uniref:hypothetical protein n=1 Tax=Brazilian marseillevirus TaxID=1813599 RepID=UPI000780DB6E|nr:hypothetical protein A3303_gp176 [Brazilian marseillevirus]AMQ10684.1 hypothetical protein [Brazilian marseillevirus]
MESKCLPQVLSLLEERGVSDFFYEIRKVERDFVKVKFFLERKSFFWVEAKCEIGWWFALPGEPSDDSLDHFLEHVDNVLKKNNVYGTD